MANHNDTRQVGEGDKSARPSSVPMLPSTIEPLPYFPNLHRCIHGVTASLLLTYLEIHHPAPRDTSNQRYQRVTSLPVTLNLDAVAADLQVSRRTLCVSLSVLCTWWPTEMARLRAARACREFLNPDHTHYGQWKPYSATGSKTWRPGTIIQLRRNFRHLSMLLQDAGIATLAVPVPAIAIPVPTLAENGVSASATYASCKKESLADIQLRASVLAGDRRNSVPLFAPKDMPGNARIIELLERLSPLGGDRRKTRYERRRVAVANGLAPASVSSAKQPKGKKRKVSNQAVGPVLPEAIKKRIMAHASR